MMLASVLYNFHECVWDELSYSKKDICLIKLWNMYHFKELFSSASSFLFLFRARIQKLSLQTYKPNLTESSEPSLPDYKQKSVDPGAFNEL